MLADDSQYLSTDGDNLGRLAVLQLEVGVDLPHTHLGEQLQYLHCESRVCIVEVATQS